MVAGFVGGKFVVCKCGRELQISFVSGEKSDEGLVTSAAEERTNFEDFRGIPAAAGKEIHKN